MEQKLSRAFFWPVNRTIVRSLKFSATLVWQRVVYRVLWHASPRHAVDRAIRMSLTPPRQAFSDAEFALLEQASPLAVHSASGRLQAWRWGRVADPAVVLVHGWGGRGTQLGAFVAPLLARGFSVVAYDAPGHGMSGRGESSLPQFLQALDAMLDHLGPVHAMVGHSVGGAVTAMALARRAAAERAVLIAPPASLSDSMHRIAKALAWPEELHARMRRRIEQRFGMNWDEFEAENSRGAQPLLVIHDSQDRDVPLREGRRHERNWPRGRLLETRGLGHRRILAAPLVIQAVADFIAGESA